MHKKGSRTFGSVNQSGYLAVSINSVIDQRNRLTIPFACNAFIMNALEQMNFTSVSLYARSSDNAIKMDACLDVTTERAVIP